MNTIFDVQTLLILPCCSTKASCGMPLPSEADPLRALVSTQIYSEVIAARALVMQSIRGETRYLTEKCEKNGLIVDGPDIGGNETKGLYMPALKRYKGNLYSAPNLKPTIESMLGSDSSPQIIILSALYGPLHPNTQIQDYNLKISDKPARIWGKAFIPFLEDYVKQNGITKVVMYLGSGSDYYKVAIKAIDRLHAKRLISKCTQYHVENGNSGTTPRQHGLRLLDDLDPRTSTGFPRSKGIFENAL